MIKAVDRPLTDKQQLAAHYYCTRGIIDVKQGYSWSQAMRDAGYKEGYITKCQFTLRRHPGIDKLIKKTKQDILDKLNITAEKVINELAGIGFSNISNYLNIDGDGEVAFKDFQGIGLEKLAAIESIKVNTTKQGKDKENTTTQFKLCSKLNALEQLGKHLGVFREDNAQKQPQTANIAIIESEAALDALELKLIQKQKALGNAICEG